MTDAQNTITNASALTANDAVKYDAHDPYTTKGLKGCYKRFFSFTGRIGRKAFSLRLLAVFIGVVLVHAANIFLISKIYWYGLGAVIVTILLAAFVVIWTLLSFMSVLSLTARRLHDFNFSARWVLLFLFFGLAAFFFGLNFGLFWLVIFAVLIVLAVIPGSKGKNRFGFRNLKAMLAEFD